MADLSSIFRFSGLPTALMTPATSMAQLAPKLSKLMIPVFSVASAGGIPSCPTHAGLAQDQASNPAPFFLLPANAAGTEVGRWSQGATDRRYGAVLFLVYGAVTSLFKRN